MNQAQKISRGGRAGVGGPIDPESLARKSFDTAFRGFDPEQVRTYLGVMADALREARERVYKLETALVGMEKRSRAAEAELKRREQVEAPEVEELSLPSLADLESGELAKLVGEETARVIETARRAAAEIVERSQEEREEILADAEKLASETVSAAEADVADLRAGFEREMAEELATGRSRAEGIAAEAAELLARAETRAEMIGEEATAEATAITDRARLEALDLIEEAKSLRRRLLEDLARRRHQARGQLELLQAGHDRLLESFAAVREALDPAAALAGVMLTEAKAAAEQARRRVETNGPVSVEDLEDLLAEVQRAGRRVSTVGTEAARPTVTEEHRQEPAEAEAEAGAGSSPEADESEMADADESAAHDMEEPPVAPPPVEGRHSSSVRVFRRGAEGDEEGLALHDQDAESHQEVGAEEGGEEGEVVTSLFARIRADRDELEAYTRPEPDAEAGSGEASEAREAGPEPAVDDAAAPVDAETLEMREAALVGPRRGLGRALKRALADEQNEVLDAISRAGRVLPLDAVFPATRAHVQRYADAARPDLRDAAYAGAHLLGSPPDEAERPAVDDLAAGLGEVIVEPLRERVRNCWDEAGDNDVELVELLRGTYRQWKNRVIDRAAATVAVEAFNRGLSLAGGREVRAPLAGGASAN